MVSVPDALVWACISRNNSFIQRRGGKTERTGKVVFSSEKGNVASLSSFKYSGLANSSTIDVVSAPNDRDSQITMLKKTASKAFNKPAKATQSTPLNKSFRTSIAAITKQSGRADLTTAVNAKYTMLANGKKAQKSLRKKSAVTTGRK